MTTLATGLGACATAPVVARHCPRGLQGSFLQLTEAQLGHGEAEWARELTLLRATGAETVIVQYTGDHAGAYEDRDEPRARPVGPLRALLAAAGTARLKVYLGLHADPRWPEGGVDDLPPPLGDPRGAGALARLCSDAPACAGFYLSSEIDDLTWGSPARTGQLAAYLQRTAARLRSLAPGYPLVVAPFFTGRLDPQAHARWWGILMQGRPFDVLALQDGVGTRRATPERAAEYLRALGPATAAAGVRLWSVVELFHQLHGTPHDDRPFAARPAAFSTLRRSLAAQRPLVEQAIGFAVLDYMNPHGPWAARRLYDRYVAWCQQPAAPPPALPPERQAPAVSTITKERNRTRKEPRT